MDEPIKQKPEKLEKIWRNEDGTFKKGHTGIGGRPVGKTLKEYAKEYLMSLPDEQKTEYLASLPADIVWKMAEGNPANATDITSKGLPILQISPEIANKNALNTEPINNSEGPTSL